MTDYVLVDIGNLSHRAHHGAKVDSSLSRSHITTIKSINLLNNYLRNIGKYEKITAFFDGKPTRRNALYQNYKSNRVSHNILGSVWNSVISDGSFVKTEFDFFSNMLNLLGCDVVHDSNEEADDLIASFCFQNPEKKKVIISDDRDFFQLINTNTVIYSPCDHKFYDVDTSVAYWSSLKKGTHPPVRPEQVRIFKSIYGDSSDNIKGVSRLEKRFASYLMVYGSINELLKNVHKIESIPVSVRDKILECESQLKNNWDLTGLIESIDVDQYTKKGHKNINLFKRICEIDCNSFPSIYNFCQVDYTKPNLPDWYNDL